MSSERKTIGITEMKHTRKIKIKQKGHKIASDITQPEVVPIVVPEAVPEVVPEVVKPEVVPEVVTEVVKPEVVPWKLRWISIFT